MLEPEQTANCWFSNYCQYSSFGCVQSAVKHIPYFSSQSGKAMMSPPITENKTKEINYPKKPVTVRSIRTKCFKPTNGL